jgi:hypothetical protein
MDHLSMLQLRLSNERIRLSQATSKGEIELRTVWIKQMEKEISGELEFLSVNEMSTDELLKELGLE